MRNTWVLPPTHTGYGKITSCRADLLRLDALIRTAATSPHSTVHVPLRKNELVDEVACWFRETPPVDLLILRTDVGLRPSAWPDVRASFRRRSSAAKALTVRTPDPREPEDWRSWVWTEQQQISLTPVLRRGGGAPPGTEFDIYGLDPTFHKSRWTRARAVQDLQPS